MCRNRYTPDFDGAFDQVVEHAHNRLPLAATQDAAASGTAVPSRQLDTQGYRDPSHAEVAPLKSVVITERTDHTLVNNYASLHHVNAIRDRKRERQILFGNQH